MNPALPNNNTDKIRKSGVKQLFIIAGEPSGDMHGASLVRELLKKDPSLKITGLGGSAMKEAGVDIIFDMSKLAVIGVFGALKNLLKFKSLFELAARKLDELKPDAVILIDYPGFNLRFAKEAKRKGIKVIYYISPQIWAWAPKRIEVIRRYVDKMIVLFKFEEELYKKAGIDVSFVGHPLLDTMKVEGTKSETLSGLGLKHAEAAVTIGLMPGSRENEVKKLLPVMLEGISLLKKSLGQDMQAFIIKSENISLDLDTTIPAFEKNRYNFMNACDMLFVASGTATLEAGILGIPMIIAYKVSPLSWFLFKPLVKIPDIGLVNVVAGKRVVPELLQNEFTPEKLAHCAASILKDPLKLNKIKTELGLIKSQLGSEGGASSRAADVVIEIIQ